MLDQNGNLIHWARKPGTLDVGDSKTARAERAEGIRRRKELLDTTRARRGGNRSAKRSAESSACSNGRRRHSLSRVDGTVRFGLAPHFSLDGDTPLEDTGDRQWQISF